ncbi:MAG: TonB-dependent receptor [Pseudomonadales bacterium]|nr:TonB-dependent receptor [Pseudomonadales bacterium]
MTHSSSIPLSTLRRHRLWLAVATCCLPLSTLVVADEVAGSDSVAATETVTVVGQAARIRSALSEQREAESLQTIVNSDAINALPDANVSESLQRMPGLSVERDQGEGRFVRIRGTSPDLNAVSVNGAQLPAPEADRRAVALDVIPADLVSSLIVTKALTPDMDANGIGGNIEIESLSALDKPAPFYKVGVEGGFNELTDETSPGATVSGGRTFGLSGEQRLGIAGAVSWERRKFGSDNIETGGAWDFDEQPAVLEELEQRDYRITRERLGAALNLDYEFNANHSAYLRTIYSRYADDERRVANAVEFAEPLTSDQGGDAAVERELKAREDVQEILSATLGAEHRLGDWTLAYSGGASEATEELSDGIGGAVFAASDDFANVGFSDSRKPHLRAPGGLYDVNRYALEEVEVEDAEATDKLNYLRFDISRDLVVASSPAMVKFGAKTSRRKKEVDENVWVYEDFADAGIDEAALGLANFSGPELDYTLGRIGPSIEDAPIRDLIGGLDAADYVDEEGSRINDYRIDEDVDAAYVMGSMNIRGLNLLTGVRYERTETEARGTGLDNGDFVSRDISNDYDNLLGSFHARYELTERAQVRGSFTQSLARPTFEQMSPAFVIDGDEAEFGNPELDAMESNNIDLGLEYYLNADSAVSVYLFYKDIDNFIYSRDVAGTGDFVGFDEALTFENGEEASLHGVELAINHRFRSLPAPWDGLLVAANATWTRSDATIESLDDGGAVRRDIALPGQSDTTGNLTFGYEDEHLSLRLAGNYKSDYLMEISDPVDARQDVFVDDQLQLDFSASYYFANGLMVQFDAVNLTDEPFYAYVGDKQYNAQYETYGRTYRLGLVFSNF